MPRSRLLPMLVCAAVLACQPPTMTRSEALRYQQQVEAEVERFGRLMNNARVDSLVGMYEPGDALRVFRPDGTASRGLAEEEGALRAFFGSIQYMNFVIQSPVTELLSGSTALTTFGHSTDLVGNDGRRRPVTAGRATVIWVRDESDDSWKIRLLHLSANVPSLN